MSAVRMYGPLGRAVERIAPFVEADPIGIYVTMLSMWSAAIGGTVRVSSRGNTRPVLLWSALVAGTGRGKGTALRAAQHALRPSLGRFLDTHITSGITSGASLVNHFYEQAEATEETEAGRDVRALVVDEEWTEVLKRTKRDPSFTTKLRAAWDGATLRNTTKEGAQEVADPAMVMHCHITPSDWSKYVSASDAAGGSLNRIMPFSLGSVPMLDDDALSLPEVDGTELSGAYAWATVRPRVIGMGEDARPLWRIVRRYARIIAESLPEAQAVFIERTAEQTLRVAACLAASEYSTVVTRDMLAAAFSLVRRSVQDAVSITSQNHFHGAAKVMKRQPLPLVERVRARIAMFGGAATSSQVLPYVGRATAEEVKALDGIEVTTVQGKTGRPSTVFRLTEDSSHTGSRPAERTVTETTQPKRTDVAPKRPQLRLVTTTPDPKPVTRPNIPKPPARSANPFRDLL
ncbi:YfjI family protein [Streptomyces violascens]|uniref:hypothetical protein n=1 Tax=Streptomyces violascens TaxID=67381 RepID=UPI003649ED1D